MPFVCGGVPVVCEESIGEVKFERDPIITLSIYNYRFTAYIYAKVINKLAALQSECFYWDYVGPPRGNPKL